MTDKRRWRIGTHYGIHVYAEMEGEDGTPHDVPVCTALTVSYAKQIVDDHNRLLDQSEAETP